MPDPIRGVGLFIAELKMDKPKGKEIKHWIAYCDWLEAQLTSTDTVKKFNRGFQKQLDGIADELLDPSYQISIKGKESDFKNFFEMVTKGQTIVSAMEKFEKAAYDKRSDEKKPLSEDSADNYLRRR